jgi:EmrB/QacA subfamily drug resistance transporter
MSEDTVPAPDSRRWLILAVVGIAQLMVVLDVTIMNIALPSAQRSLGFSNVDRQWVVTAYALAFGSLLLFCGRLADLLGRKVTFLTGLAGFAIASAVGGASGSFAMLVTARACQGCFGAVLAPSALSLLTTTFTDPKERGRAFAVFGALAGGGSAIGLLLGGALTQYLSWRWCLFVNLFFAGLALAGGLTFIKRQERAPGATLDVPGVLIVSSGMFSIVYGLSNAAAHTWGTSSTWGFLVAGAALLVAFAFWQRRARDPLLPGRVIGDRNRAGAYLAIFVTGAGMFGIFLFLIYYLQITLRYSPVKTGLAVLPMVVCIAIGSQLANVVLLPRLGPRPILPFAMLLGAAGTAWLTRIGLHSSYVTTVLGPLCVVGFGLGNIFSTAINTGTYGVAPRDSGVASASVNTGQQLGGSVGTALLNTMAASATTSYLASHALGRPTRAVIAMSLLHGYTTAFWWSAGIFAGGAVVCAALLRSGPLFPRDATAKRHQPAAVA